MKRLWTALVAAIIIGTIGMVQNAAAASRSVVIQAVQAGTLTSALEEFVIVRNTGDYAVDVSGWKVVYTSASGLTSTTLATFSSPVPDHILLPGQTSEALFSNVLVAVLGLEPSAITFSPGLNAADGTISLYDAKGELVDRVGWGTATLFENKAAAAPGTQTLWRTDSFDSDDNAVDFSLLTDQEVDLAYGSLVDVRDECSNIEGIQLTVPDGLVAQADGACNPVDYCDNIDGTQTDTTGYDVVGTNCYPLFVPADIRLSELLPNPQGTDTGNEFIELYNASDNEALLDDYQLRIDGKLYTFPTGSTIMPGGYAIFSDTQLKLTFANTTGKLVELVGRGDVLIDALPAYSNAPDDQSWALIDATWQYTNQPTPGGPNKASLIGSGSADTDGVLAECGEGRERNPATGRCRTIPVVSQLVPCGPGQERNPATNRCRSVVSASASLAPCGPGQERNPATNRCRSTASATSALAPCAEGQERNPETNRCRKIASATPPEAAFPVEAVKDTATSFAAWWALGGVVVLGLGYAGWEYRHEVSKFVRNITSRGKS